jgi:hypothetical protein
MEFRNCDVQLTREDISLVERELDLLFPAALVNHFLSANGGRPYPYVYEDERVDTTVSAALPLKTGRGEHTAVDTYRHLVLELELLPAHFFPFAADSGGDYFYVDCESEWAEVYLYRHDTAGEPLVPLKMGLDKFWDSLKPE